jgi:TM2 domain-containing membrane protein YozV
MNKPKISDKKKLTVILLCWLFGLFGIHRFYTGKYLSGTLQILLLGLMGLLAAFDIGYLSAAILIFLFAWLIIDCLRIIMGKFTDKDGKHITDWV